MSFWDDLKETVSRFGKVTGKSAQITGDLARLDFADVVKHTGDIVRYTKLDKGIQLGMRALDSATSVGSDSITTVSPEDMARKARIAALDEMRNQSALRPGRSQYSGNGRSVLNNNTASITNQSLLTGR